MKWFFALGEKTPAGKQYCEMAKVAVHTALRHTSLRPHFIYDGAENYFTRWLREREIPITPHRSSVAALYEKAGLTTPDVPLSAALSGAFLRVDLPALALKMGETEKIFYTDCDVIFQADVVEELAASRCRLFSVAPEFDRADHEAMNTGAMLMNVRELHRSLPEFRHFIVAQMESLRADSWDQSAYRRFYRDANGARLWDDLPATLNWKPYWGENAAAKIIHFHGPKPFQRHHIASHFPELRPLTGSAYEAWCDRYEALLVEAR